MDERQRIDNPSQSLGLKARLAQMTIAPGHCLAVAAVAGALAWPCLLFGLDAPADETVLFAAAILGLLMGAGMAVLAAALLQASKR